MNNIIQISNEDKKKARFLASKLNTPLKRKMALVDMLGLDVACNFFSNHNQKLFSNICLHKVPFILDEYRICDLNISGNIIYVVTVYNESLIRIPKIHFDSKVMPNYYLIVEVDKFLNKGFVAGFMRPKDVLKCVFDNNYYYPETSDLDNTDVLFQLLSRRHSLPMCIGNHDKILSLFPKIISNNLTDEEKKFVILHLMTCQSCLRKLLNEIFKKNDNNVNVDTHEFSKKDAVAKIIDSSFSSDSSGISNLKFLMDCVKNSDSYKISAKIDLSKIKEYSKNLFKKVVVFFTASFTILKNFISKLSKKQIIILISILFGVLFFVCVLNRNGSDKIVTQVPKTAEYSDFDTNSPDNLSGNSPLMYAQNTDYTSRAAEIKDISWDVDKSIAGKQEFTNFLQVLGKNIKLNLQNEFIVIDQIPVNKIIKINIKFSNNASVKNISYIVSSGNETIDKKILDTLYETLSYVKAPRNGFIMPDINLILNINLF